MREEQSPTPRALHALCRQAGEQAAGWHPSRPGPSPRAPLLKLALVGGLSLLGLAVVAAQFGGQAAASASAPQPLAAAASPQDAPVSAAPAAAASPAAPVRWQGAELVIDFDEEPLLRAVELLAQATHTSVAGVQLLQKPRPATLHWRGSDVTAAWQQLLQGRAAFSSSCSASSCQLWINGEVALPAAAAAPGAEAAPAATPPTELEMSQPGGSC